MKPHLTTKATHTPGDNAEPWEQYQHEMANGYGFGHPSRWSDGPRNFAAFCAARRISLDFDRAMRLLKYEL